MPMNHDGSCATLVNFHTPFLCRITAPVTQWWVLAPRRTGGLQCSILMQHYGSCATLVDSGEFSCSTSAPAPHLWIPATRSYAAVQLPRHIDGSPRPILMIAVSTQDKWTTTPHSHTVVDPRAHYGSRTTPVDARVSL